ncbi:hypothetical protein [Paenibacillus pabuli]|uniref:hypothetical protein n=1 Tax=Paenibacillus pabuli TaxID=1472 RepID=UPI00200056BE|nr:hypothetical protein [Paenibacillus pabuli]UPK42695.1 hypothetical protein KET34_26540 [Paenibacillus pabuli]
MERKPMHGLWKRDYRYANEIIKLFSQGSLAKKLNVRELYKDAVICYIVNLIKISRKEFSIPLSIYVIVEGQISIPGFAILSKGALR